MRDGGVWADQGVIAGCSGGLFDNITEAADIIRGKYTGSGAFSFDVYPTSVPVSLELMRTLKRFLSFVTEAVGEFESIGTTRAFAKELNNNTREHSSALRT